MEALKERPPYVTFELRAVEDRAASIAEGHYVSKDVAYALITPSGSKDRIERIVEDWFDQLSASVQEERFPREWLKAYQGAYEDWKAGNAPLLVGTDVKNWPVLSPSQVKLLVDLGIRAVEDLAVANEETISRLGMGGRALKQKAVEWLSSAKDTGRQVEEITALQIANKELTERNEAMMQQLTELGQRLQLLEGGKPTKL